MGFVSKRALSRQGVPVTDPSGPIILQLYSNPAASEGRARLFRGGGYCERRAPLLGDVLPLLPDVQPDLVLLHAGEGQSGIDGCRTIKKARPDHRPRKLLVLSGETTTLQAMATRGIE